MPYCKRQGFVCKIKGQGRDPLNIKDRGGDPLTIRDKGGDFFKKFGIRDMVAPTPTPATSNAATHLIYIY